MGDPAQKEPSMEDILSSIRKIVSQDERTASADRGQNAGSDPGEDDRQRERLEASQESGEMENDSTLRHQGNRELPGGGSLSNLARQVRENASLSQAQSPFVRENGPATGEVPDDDPVKERERSEPQLESGHPAENIMEMRRAEERRSEPGHQLREAAQPDPASDAEASAFREALVSPATEKAVAHSFERMKQSVLENIDSRMDRLMRPLLADWLDRNLPEIVERVVREEVQRLSRSE